MASVLQYHLIQSPSQACKLPLLPGVYGGKGRNHQKPKKIVLHILKMAFNSKFEAVPSPPLDFTHHVANFDQFFTSILPSILKQIVNIDFYTWI